MSRTTVDIDDVVLRDLKRLQKQDGRTLGRLVSDLLARSLARPRVPPTRSVFQWNVAAGGALVDILDKDAVEAALRNDHA